jgi:N-hydroxyarylamine O-acetyltransferase
MHEPSRMNEDLKARYLQILGIDESPPTLGFLNRIVSAHLVRIPFENISKLHRFRLDGQTSIPSLDSYLDGIEGMNFGGTCYANNTHLYILLSALGFKVKLCGADMNRPDVHAVSMIKTDGREYLVDVGYGAPFFKPMARDLETEHTIDFGRCRYVLHPQDAKGRSRLEMLRDDRPVHSYLAKPEARNVEDFAEVVRDSYRLDATFMNTLVAERFLTGRSVRIHNLTLTETEVNGQSRSTDLHDLDELIEAIEHHLEIPVDITRHAISGIRLDADIYS